MSPVFFLLNVNVACLCLYNNSMSLFKFSMSVGTVSSFAILAINIFSFWSMVIFSMLTSSVGMALGVSGVGFLSAIFSVRFVVTMSWVL